MAKNKSILIGLSFQLLAILGLLFTNYTYISIALFLLGTTLALAGIYAASISYKEKSFYTVTIFIGLVMIASDIALRIERDNYYILGALYVIGIILTTIATYKEKSNKTLSGIKKKIQTKKAEKKLETSKERHYVVKKQGSSFHKRDCFTLRNTSEYNLIHLTSRQQGIDRGLKPCKMCKA